MIGRVALVLALVALAVPLSSLGPAPNASHYLPQPGDAFSYAETIVLDGGQGNYSGYTEHTFVNGSISVAAVSLNGSVATHYASTGFWFNNQGQSQPSSESGYFGFSENSFLYLNGTDNQTGYVHPYVWFYIDNTDVVGADFYLLNTPMTVIAVAAPYPMASSPTGYVATIEAEGNGSYQRNDVYGVFTATYTWIAYFDPSTGYIVGYVYTEHDSDSAGDAFTWTDSLSDTHTTFPLTAANAPPSPAPAASSPFSETVVIVIVVIVVVLVAAIVLALRARSRRGAGMAAATVPRHSGPSAPIVPPTYGAPPAVNLVPGGQPAIKQIVIKETVKVPCAYCGTLMDSTATVCPKCGAPRT